MKPNPQKKPALSALSKMRCLSVAVLASGGLVLISDSAVAAGVDNATAPFQMEGDTTKTGDICFGTDPDGQQAITDTSGGSCPSSVDFPGFSFTKVNFGADSDDWSSFTHSIVGRAHRNDQKNSQTDNSFLGSSTKDTFDISAWTWTPSKPQGKADIVNAIATAYQVGDDIYIYAGLDRYDNSGSTTAGFWFVQDPNFALCTGAGQAIDGANSLCTASGTFVGQHTNNDLLIVSDFSQGGAAASIVVYSWQDGALVLEGSRTPAPCDPILDNNVLCGAVNNKYALTTTRQGNTVLTPTTVAPPTGISYSGKDGNTAYNKGEFLEVGINLNEFFDNLPCFSRFMAETRSSNSVTASLSDLTAPVAFPLCSLSVSKTCTSGAIVPGTDTVRYNFTGTINNTGSATIYVPNLTDTPPTGTGQYITDTLKLGLDTGSLLSATPGQAFELSNGSIAGGASLGYAGRFDSSVILGNGAKNSMTATASPSSTGTPQSITGSTDWGSTLPASCVVTGAPGLSLQKLCKTCLVTGNSNLAVNLKEGFKLCNTGNVSISSITLKDCRNGTWSNITTAPTCSTTASTITLPKTTLAVGECMIANNLATPTQCDSTTGQNCNFADNAYASGTAALGGGTIYSNGGVQTNAQCSVCPINTTCPDYVSDNFPALP